MCRAVVLEAAGVDQPRALAVAYKDREQLVHTVHSLRGFYPKVSQSFLACVLLSIAFWLV